MTSMHTTNYANTLITVSPDTKAVAATVPPTGRGSVAELQFAMMHDHDYTLTSDDVIFGVLVERKGVLADELEAARDQFFAKGQPCLRTSPLAKTYGWGIHADAQGRVALVPMGSSAYDALVNDNATVKRPAMKASR
ncbi:MAG: DUF6157 family protein [Mycobacteriaceae bacterium]